MTESKNHKDKKRKGAGKSGETEVKLPTGKILDAATNNTATEVERSGNFIAAAQRLKESGKKRKVLKAPDSERSKAAQAMRKVGVKGSVTNLNGGKRISV